MNGKGETSPTSRHGFPGSRLPSPQLGFPFETLRLCMFFFFFQFFFFFFPSPAMRSQKEQTPARGLKVCHYVYDRTHLRGSYLAARGRASLGCRVGMETKCLALAAAGRRKHTRCLTKVPRYGISNMALRWPATRDKDRGRKHGVTLAKAGST